MQYIYLLLIICKILLFLRSFDEIWSSCLVQVPEMETQTRDDDTVEGGKGIKKSSGNKAPPPPSPIAIPGYEWVYVEVNSYPTRFQTHNSIEEELKRKVDMTTLDNVELLIVEPCRTEECVFIRACKGETNFVYMYKDVFK